MKKFSKLLSLILCLILVPQFALASKTDDLKAIIDDYTYTMTVEWDQKDKAFAKKQNETFQKKLKHMLEQGLTKEELKEAFQGRAQIDMKTIETELLLIDTKNPEAVGHFINEKVKRAYAQGSSWNGEATATLLIGTLVVAFVALMVLAIVKSAGSSSSGSGSYSGGDSSGDDGNNGDWWNGGDGGGWSDDGGGDDWGDDGGDDCGYYYDDEGYEYYSC